MAQIDVVMPKMGESIMEGTVLTWHKAVGDEVALDETLLEIGTDKVDSEIPSPAAGILKQILVPEGETVDVGTPIAILETEVTESVAAPAPAPPVAEAPTPPPAAPAPATDDVQVVMPKMGESIMEGTVLTWHKAVGDEVALDETLLEIGTDKVDSEIPSPAAGILKQILVPEGETVDVGTPIAWIGASLSTSASPAPAPAPSVETPAPQSVTVSVPPTGDGALQTPALTDASPAALKRHGADGRFYSPLVRSIASVEGISQQELEAIAGTGQDGRVTKKDVMHYVENRQAQPAPAVVTQPTPQAPAPPAVATPDGARVEVIEMDRMRQIIADHMVRSKATSPHVTSFAEIDVTNLVALRERNKAAFQKREGVKLTYTPFFVHAAVEALRTHPLLNASVEDKRILIKKDFNIGIAVALGTTGLIVPVIRNAGGMNLIGLTHAVADLANRARNRQLQPDELQSGTFTVTNVGSLGSIMGTPIINQPQVGILSPGAIKKRPAVVEIPGIGDTIAIRHIMFVSLSYDHRIVDGAMAASYLRTYRDLLESLDPNEDL